MKKLLILMCALVLGTVAQAGNDAKVITVSDLPQAAQVFIVKYFAEMEVAIAQKTRENLFGTNYEVTFINGDKVEFDHNGEWKEVDCQYGIVLLQIVTPAIRTYVLRHYPNVEITHIERDKGGCEVKLANGIELEFDAKGSLIDLDR